MLGWYCFSMEKLETWIYIQWFWLQIVMVSPGTHLVKKYWFPVQKHWIPDKKNKQVCDWKCLGLCVTRQLIWLTSLTESKTLYYCSTLKLKYSPSKGYKKYASSTTAIHVITATEYTNGIFLQIHMFRSFIDLCVLGVHAMNIILHFGGFLCIRDAGRSG